MVEAGGFRTVIAEVNGDKVYSKLKYEAGVHRVQVRAFSFTDVRHLQHGTLPRAHRMGVCYHGRFIWRQGAGPNAGRYLGTNNKNAER